MEGLNSLVCQRIQFAGLDSFFNLPVPRFRIKFDEPFSKSVEFSGRESQHFLFDSFNVTHETRSFLLARVYHKAVRRKPSFPTSRHIEELHAARCVVSEYGLREGVLVHLARSCRAHP